MRLNAVEKSIIEDMASIANRKSLAETINDVRKRFPYYEEEIKNPRKKSAEEKQEEPINIEEIKEYMGAR